MWWRVRKKIFFTVPVLPAHKVVPTSAPPLARPTPLGVPSKKTANLSRATIAPLLAAVLTPPHEPKPTLRPIPRPLASALPPLAPALRRILALPLIPALLPLHLAPPLRPPVPLPRPALSLFKTPLLYKHQVCYNYSHGESSSAG